MRIARSTSPRGRKSEPSAKCSSMVCGSTLTTSMNASIALSGCSFNRKLRPLKYDCGSARDSDTRCLISMRAASQPSTKKSGSVSNHQYSISIRAAPILESGLKRFRHAGQARRARQGADFALEADNLAPLPDHDHEARRDAQGGARGEEHEQYEHQRRMPFKSEKIPHGDAVAVLDGETQQQQE